MLIVLDRPVIEWAVIEAARSGIKEVFCNILKKNSIIEHFDRSEILESLLKKKKQDKIKLINSQNQLGSFSLLFKMSKTWS